MQASFLPEFPATRLCLHPAQAVAARLEALENDTQGEDPFAVDSGDEEFILRDDSDEGAACRLPPFCVLRAVWGELVGKVQYPTGV